MPLNVAVVGLGKLGLLHAGLANVVPGSRLAAVADPSSVVLEGLKAYAPNLRTYSTHEAMLSGGGIDAVVIATPTGLHVPIALDCVDAGLPVLIEKPLSLSVDQARPLVAALKRRPVANMVGYMGRHLDTFSKAKRLLETGAVGRLQMFRSFMYIGQLWRGGKGWRYDREMSGGGVLITQNSHLVDKLLWYFGDLEEVSGNVRSLYSEGMEDHCHAYFSFRSGLAGFMDASWSARHYRTPSISIHVQGRDGTLDVDDDHVRLYLDKDREGLSAGWTVWRKPDLYRAVSIDVGGPQYTLQMEEFVAGVLGARKIGSDVDSALRTQMAIDAIYQSAEGGGAPVRLAETVE